MIVARSSTCLHSSVSAMRPDRTLSDEARTLLRHATVADLKRDAAELTALCQDLEPGPNLLDGLSDDVNESRCQLLWLYLRERGMRRRLMQLLAAEE